MSNSVLLVANNKEYNGQLFKESKFIKENTEYVQANANRRLSQLEIIVIKHFIERLLSYPDTFTVVPIKEYQHNNKYIFLCLCSFGVFMGHVNTLNQIINISHWTEVSLSDQFKFEIQPN